MSRRGAMAALARRGEARLQPGDLEYLSVTQRAGVVERAPAAMWAVYLMLAAVVAVLGWAAVSPVDIVTRATARVVPDGKEQAIASLEGGILREMLVREGQEVTVGQELALLDPTRVESQQAEGRTKRTALRATLARLEAESSGGALRFPDDVRADAGLVAAETDSYRARTRALQEAVATNQRNVALLESELAVAEQMSAKGLMSEVEVMRVRRQVNDLKLQTQERVNRFRQEASAEFVRVRTELEMTEEQMVVRDDALRRTTLTSPVHGVVKAIRNHTVGGVVAPGAPLVEIVPIGPRLLVEARVPPREIGFVKVGQPVEIKISAYEYALYGSIKGTVVTISPDALGDPDRAGPDATWYRALVRAEGNTLKAHGKPLAVLPGMVGTADIRTGRRTVLQYLLLPMTKSQEAFRER